MKKLNDKINNNKIKLNQRNDNNCDGKSAQRKLALIKNNNY